MPCYSGPAGHHETRGRAQKIGFLVEQIKVTGGLSHQGFGLGASALAA